MKKVAITGVTGRMGRALVAALVHDGGSSRQICANQSGLQLAAGVARPGSDWVGKDVGSSTGLEKLGVPISAELATTDFDIVIDFTLPQPALATLAECVARKKALVLGTTGFDSAQIREIESAAHSIPIVYAPNMSVGVNLTLRLLEQAAAVIGEQSDIEISETHHRNKLDAPSGTALHMGQVIASTLGRDFNDCAKFGRQSAAQVRDRETIGFSSIRAGDVVGDHTVIFATEGERIEITHKASDRSIYATGALRAATWLLRKQPGLYDMQDVLGLRS